MCRFDSSYQMTACACQVVTWMPTPPSPGMLQSSQHANFPNLICYSCSRRRNVWRVPHATLSHIGSVSVASSCSTDLRGRVPSVAGEYRSTWPEPLAVYILRHASWTRRWKPKWQVLQCDLSIVELLFWNRRRGATPKCWGSVVGGRRIRAFWHVLITSQVHPESHHAPPTHS